MQKPVTRIYLTRLNKYLDLTEEDAAAVVYAASDVRDLTQKSGTTSRSLKLADTTNNHETLGYAFEINTVTGTFDLNKAEPCVLISGTTPIMDNSVFQLLKVNKSQDNNNTEQKAAYEGIVKDQTADFFTTLGNKELTDLKMGDLDHTYSSANVIASFSNTVANGYKYLMPLTQGNVFNLSDFRMAIYAKTYFDRIFANAGFSYQWDELTDANTRFDKWIIPYNGEVPKLRQDVQASYRVEANKSLPQDLTAVAANGTPPPVPPTAYTIPNETLDTSGSYDNTTSIYTSPLYYLGGGNISFQLNIQWELILNNVSGATAYMVGNSGTVYKPAAYLGKNASLTSGGAANLNTAHPLGWVQINNGGSIPAGTTVIASGTTPVSFAGAATTNSTTYKFVAACGTQNYISNKWRAANNPAAAEVKVDTTLRIRSVQLVIVPSMSELGFNSRIYAQDFVPKKIKQADFIKSIFTANNLMVEVDLFNSNKLILKSRDKYYDDGKTVDWTKKLAKEKEQQVVFLPSLTSKKMVLTYKEDNDAPNVTYTTATNEVYGQVEFTFDSEHVKGVDTKELIFSPTPVTTNDVLNVVVPMIAASAPKTNIRLLYDGGTQTANSYTIVDYVNSSGSNVGTTQTVAPMLSHFDKAYNPAFDLNFSPNDLMFYNQGAKTNNTLFNLKWRRTMGQMNSGKMLIAYFDLNVKDISSMKLSDKILVDRTYYNINKVEYNANSTAPTKVELITVDSEVKFGAFKTRIPYQPSTGDTIKSPIKQVVGVGSAASNVVLSNGEVDVKGKNNVVGQNVKSGTINGDGNVTNSEKVMIVGDNIEYNEVGIATQNLKVTEGADFNTMPNVGGVPLDQLITSENIYTDDGTLTSDRVLDGDNKDLSFENLKSFKIVSVSSSGTDTTMSHETGLGISHEWYGNLNQRIYGGIRVDGSIGVSTNPVSNRRIYAIASGSDIGVYMQSTNGQAVYANSTNGLAIDAVSTGSGFAAVITNTSGAGGLYCIGGTYGIAGEGVNGVYGYSTGGGYGGMFSQVSGIGALHTNGKVVLQNLPISPIGLATDSLWNNSGSIEIV